MTLIHHNFVTHASHDIVIRTNPYNSNIKDFGYFGHKYLFPNKKIYNWITEIRINKRIANRAS